MGFGLPRSYVIAAAVAYLAIVSSPAFAASDPVNLVQNPVSDRAVELTWDWPAAPDYPAELDVYRDGNLVTALSSSSATSFLDTGLVPNTPHYYQLKADWNALTPAIPTYVTTRTDLPIAPSNVGVVFSPSNVATVTWQRGDSDSDVTYQVVATPVSGSVISAPARYAIGDSTPGSLTMSGFASFTLYTFTVDAVEDAGSGDPGGTVAGDASVTKRSNDVLPPQWPAGSVSGSRLSLGTITASWPTGSDSGTGLASYAVCVDVISCSTVPVGGGATQTATVGSGLIRNDGLSHSVSVVAVDGAGNQSVPLMTSVLMPVLAPPVISLSGGTGNGCTPLIAHATPPDLGANAHLFVDGATTETPLDQEIAGTPYQQLTLVANSTFGADTSAISGPTVARVYDPIGPETSPAVHTKTDSSTNSATLSWDAVTTSGAPIIGYELTIATLPGYENGFFIEQSSAPFAKLTNLQNQFYIVQVTAVDGCFRNSPPVANPPRFLVSDIEPPSAPVLAVPVTGGHDVRLTWSPSTDNVGVDEYKVFMNGVQVTHTEKTTFDVTGLPDAWPADYYVVATDTAGLASLPSVTRTATTKDVTPPVFVGNVSYAPQGANFTLKWSAATDNVGVTVYQVMRDGSAIANVTGTSYIDKNVPAGNHHWDIQAFDAAGNGSILHGTDAYSSGPPKSTVASALRVVKSKGAKMVTVGGASGARIVLSFDLTQAYARGSLRLQVVKSTRNKVKGKSTRKLKTKVRISLPLGVGRTTAGKRLGERLAKKGAVTIPLGRLPVGPLRLVVTATGGTVTISGKGAGSKAPMIAPSS